MLKKMMLLAMAVGALVALAGPATASASKNLQWETGSTPLNTTTAESENVHFTGTLTSTKGGLKISCNATANVDLWNSPTLGAHGEVTSLSLTPDSAPGEEGCTVAVFVSPVGYVDVTKCHVQGTAIFDTTPPIWTVTTSTTGTAHHVTIDHARFVNKFTGPGCLQHLGIPEGFEAGDTGDVTGVAGSGGDCIVFNNAGTFVNETTVDGELCATGDLRLTTIEEE